VKKIIIAVIAVPVLFWMVWISFSASSIQAIIEDSISDGQLGIEVKGLKKGLFYTIDIDTLTLKTRRNEFVSFKDIYGRVNPLNLLMLKLDLSAQGHLKGGNISGEVTFAKSMIDGGIHFSRISLGDLQFLKRAGISGTGTLDGSFILRDSAGHLDFITQDAHFEQADFSGIRVPLDIFHTVSGALDIHGNVVHVAAISLEGKDIYAKLKGTIRDAVMDMTMEFMPGKSYAENPLVLAGIEPYKISPGYYMIPVKGDLLKSF
jgi:type II secretion system protein N